MFGQGYVLVSIVTAICLVAFKKFNDISKED